MATSDPSPRSGTISQMTATTRRRWRWRNMNQMCDAVTPSGRWRQAVGFARFGLLSLC